MAFHQAMLVLYGTLFGCNFVLLTHGQRVSLQVIEDEYLHHKHRHPGCWLGDNFYKFGERWSPILEPFGYRPCVKCQCGKVERHGVLDRRGRVVCKNIKDSCPMPRCDQPVLRENTCCNVCLGTHKGHQGAHFEDDISLIPDILIDNTSRGPSKIERESNGDKPDNTMDTLPRVRVRNDTRHDKTEVNGKSLVLTALLVGNSVPGYGSAKTRAVASVHLTVIASSRIVFAIRYTKLKKLRSVRLQDNQGNVLMEKDLIRYSKQSDKICGVWENVHPAVITAIADVNLSVMITTRREGANIAGVLRPYTNAEDETFSALLSTSDVKGTGGVAILKYEATDSIATYTIRLEGLHIRSARNQDYLVTFGMETGIFYQRVLQLSKKTGFLTDTLRMSHLLAKRLARGRLELRVTTVTGAILRGIFEPRLMCSTFHAGLVARGNNSPVGSGYAVLELHEHGRISFKVQLVTKMKEVLLQRRVQDRRWKTFRNLTHTFQTSNSSKGHLRKLHARDISALLDGDLYILIVVESKALHDSQSAFLRGRFVQTQYMEHINIAEDQPMILRGRHCPVVAFAWLFIGRDCKLRHHILLPGQQAGHGYSFTVETPGDQSEEDMSIRLTIPQSRHTIANLPGVVLASFHAGLATVLVDVSYIRTCGTLKGNVTLHNTCWLNEGSGRGLDSEDVGRNDIGYPYKYSCFYEGTFYEDGETWLPAQKNSCLTCACQSGTLQCHNVVCPPLDCSRQVRQEGHCCPICEEENSTEKKSSGSCFYHGDKRWHPVGVVWHPYIPSMGYAKCALCTCMPRAPGFDINCTRLECPTLHCNSLQRYRLNEDDCCQVCLPDSTTQGITDITIAKERLHRKQACVFDGKTYSHRSKWHPRVSPFGPMKCYRCRCRNGKSICRKRRCKHLTCKHQYRPSGFCCPVCLNIDYEQHRRKH